MIHATVGPIAGSLMVRTLKPARHAIRREVLLGGAERPIRTWGPDRTGARDTPGEAGVSESAVCHCLGSKVALLGAVVERIPGLPAGSSVLAGPRAACARFA